jgi:hypothetical protein
MPKRDLRVATPEDRAQAARYNACVKTLNEMAPLLNELVGEDAFMLVYNDPDGAETLISAVRRILDQGCRRSTP